MTSFYSLLLHVRRPYLLSRADDLSLEMEDGILYCFGITQRNPCNFFVVRCYPISPFTQSTLTEHLVCTRICY